MGLSRVFHGVETKIENVNYGHVILKTTLFLLACIILIWVVLLIVLGFVSRSGKPPGLSDSRLASCPSSPNCICTEYESDNKAFVSPVQISIDSHDVIDDAQTVALEMGGKIVSRDRLYLAVTFSSRLFGLVDDFEIRWAPEPGLLHIRSASRTGHSDLGVNGKRVEDFKNRYKALQKKKLPS